MERYPLKEKHILKKFIIDRFEHDKAVLEMESGETIVIPKSQIPAQAVEGDVLVCSGYNTLVIDKTDTNKLRKEIEVLMDSLWED